MPVVLCRRIPTAPNTTASARLVSGPTTAIRKSAAGVSASPSSSETPPNNHRVMPRTRMPLWTATMVWDASWARSDAKKRRAPTVAAAQ